MEEIKLRLKLVDSIVEESISVGNKTFNFEIIAIQLRKTLELIAFASLSANKELYAEAHKNFENEWSAKRLLKNIAELHPEFYPKPILIKQVKNSSAQRFNNVKTGFLTPDQFVTLYDKCNKVMHARNPFSTSGKTVDFGFSIQQWVKRIQCLLKIHRIEFVGHPEIWIVIMQDPPDGKVRAYVATPLKES